MKKGFLLLAALVLLALCGCDGAPEGSASPSPEPSGPVSAAPEVLTPEELLAQYPMDDGHDAFLVPTGGRLGTLLVTVERGEEDTHTEFNRYQYTLSVWDPADMDGPIQTFEEKADVYSWKELMDADFDGYTDFCCVWNGIAHNQDYSLYLWDEDQGKFIRGAAFISRGGPLIDRETQTIRIDVRDSAVSGVTEVCCWKDGKLVCMREVECCYPDLEGNTQDLVVRDRIDGEMTEVYRKTFVWKSYSMEEEGKWYDLDYHGEGPDLRELLAQQPMDDDHDAFLVPTGGRLGTLLVTVERGGWNTDGTFGWYDTTLSVWDPQEMDKPLQTIKTRMQGPFDIMLTMEDVNFDGHMDFEFLCIQYVRSLAFQLWLWEEEAGQFVEEPSFVEILNPWVDPESETIIGGNWETWNVRAQTVHRWEDGKLVFVREVKHIYPDPDVGQEEGEMVVYEFVDGELTEISRGPFDPMGSG